MTATGMEKIICSISEFVRKIYEKHIYDNLDGIAAILASLWAGW
jgi:hypothetical protein